MFPLRSESNSTLSELDEEKGLSEKQIDDTEVHLLAIWAMTCGMGGLQLVWSTIFSNGTAYLLALELPDVMTSLVWAMPAICGCFVQPLVGARSDLCNHAWGRRKPYMVAGAAGTSLSIFCLAWAGTMGRWTGRVFFLASPVDASTTATKLYAVLSIFMLSIAIQPVQCSLRALVLDLCPERQQAQAQSWTVRFTNAGQIIGCLAGLIYQPGADSLGEVSTFRFLSAVTILALMVTVALTFWCVREESYASAGPRNSTQISPGAVVRTLVGTFSESSHLIKRVLVVQTVAWMGWFGFLFYYTSYSSSLYLDALPEHVSRRLGGNVASLVSLLFSCVALAASVFLPCLVGRAQYSLNLGRRSEPPETDPQTLFVVWSLSLVLSAALMMSTVVVKAFTPTAMIMALNGISWAVTNWVPFTLIGQLALRQDQKSPLDHLGASRSIGGTRAGSIIGLHNVAVSSPQIMAAGICGVIFWLARGVGSIHGDLWVLRAGGLAHLIAACLAIRSRLES